MVVVTYAQIWMYCYFFFFKHETEYEIMSGDWGSDVCSSDLVCVCVCVFVCVCVCVSAAQMLNENQSPYFSWVDHVSSWFLESNHQWIHFWTS